MYLPSQRAGLTDPFQSSGLKLENKDVDDFTYLKKQAARQLQDARKLLEERDALFAVSSGSGGKESVQLSSKIREILREAKESHKKMFNHPTKFENDLADGKVVWSWRTRIRHASVAQQKDDS
jgi:predicted component of type VI protein secretion system